MKTKIFSIMAAALALGLAACDDSWEPRTEKTGELSLATMDVDVNVAERLVSRQAESVDVSDFTVAIYHGEEAVGTWKYAQMPELVKLPVGEYTARVYSHEVQKQDWDKPYYLGSKAFAIESGKITNIGTVECSFSSVRVTIIYDESMQGHIGSDCKVTVVANDAGRLEFTSTETRSGYFEAVDGSNTLVATFTGTIDGEPATITRTYADVAPGTHYRITYVARKPQPGDEVGNVTGGGITVETEVVSTDAEGNITIEEEVIDNPGQRPGSEEEGGEGPGDDPKPEGNITLESEYLSLTSPNNTSEFGTEAKPAVVNIASDHGIAHLRVKIESNNADFNASVAEMLPFEFDLATVSAEDPENAEKIGSLGLPMGPYTPGDDGVTRADFDITMFMDILVAFSGQHKFTLTVADDNAYTKEITLIFNVDR